MESKILAKLGIDPAFIFLFLLVLIMDWLYESTVKIKKDYLIGRKKF